MPDKTGQDMSKPVQRPDQRRSTQVTDQTVLQLRKTKQDLPETEAEEAAMLAMERWKEILKLFGGTMKALTQIGCNRCEKIFVRGRFDGTVSRKVHWMVLGSK
jgi:hypothetical protein